MTLMPQLSVLAEEDWSGKIKVTKLKCQPNGGDKIVRISECVKCASENQCAYFLLINFSLFMLNYATTRTN